MAKSLVDATMPDGTKYEDWVRRQAGEDVPAPATPPTPPGAGANLTESPLDYRPQTA
jgi:hypothetical protein